MILSDNKDFPAPGAYAGISFEDYASVKAANSSILRALATMTPAKAKHYVENRKVTKAMQEGQDLHTYILEPERFSRECFIAQPCQYLLKSGKRKDTPCGAGTAEWDGKAWLCGKHREEDGFKGISPELHNRLRLAREEIWRVAGDVMQAVEDGEAYTELSLIWKDEETGVLCKARLDIFQKDFDGEWNEITDLKKCRSANPETFGGDVGAMGYHIQAAWYRRGAAACFGDATYVFRFVAVELNPDEENGAQVLVLDDEADRVGEMAMKSALAVYADCLKSGEWPGYSAEAKTVSLRPWVARREELLNS